MPLFKKPVGRPKKESDEEMEEEFKGAVKQEKEPEEQKQGMIQCTIQTVEIAALSDAINTMIASLSDIKKEIAELKQLAQ